MSTEEIYEKLGELDGTLSALVMKVDDMHDDIKALNAFRWRVVGGGLAAGAIAGGLVTVVGLLLKLGGI